MNNVFLLSCSISANVRQTTQIKMEDLQLPDSVVDTLQKQQSMSIRPNLSGSLKRCLDELRLLQRHLYDECCIHNGDTHFLCAADFYEAMDIISQIRGKAAQHNQKLKSLWSEELAKWTNTIDKFVEPLFEDLNDRAIVREAYLKLFPTAKEFESPIDVYVVGPHAIDIEVAKTSSDHIATTAAVNTAEVYQAAQDSAADRALEKCAELIDDLDVRTSSRVGERQTGTTKRRGSWEITAQDLSLISQHVPGLEKAKELANELLKVGKTMNGAINPKDRNRAFQRYLELKNEMHDEFKQIVERRDSSKGAESLHKSLALSGTYKELMSAISNAESEEQLQSLMGQVDTEVKVYSTRVRELQKHVEKRRELIGASSVNLEELVAEVRELPVNSVKDCDF